MQTCPGTWSRGYTCEPPIDILKTWVDALTDPSGEIRTAVQHQISYRHAVTTNVLLAFHQCIHPRETILRGRLQSLGLYPANSLFVGGYLTTRGDPFADTYAMIEDAGFEVAGQGDDARPRPGFQLAGSDDLLRPDVAAVAE